MKDIPQIISISCFSISLGLLLALLVVIIQTPLAIDESMFTNKILYIFIMLIGITICLIQLTEKAISNMRTEYYKDKQSKVKPWILKKV